MKNDTQYCAQRARARALGRSWRRLATVALVCLMSAGGAPSIAAPEQEAATPDVVERENTRLEEREATDSREGEPTREFGVEPEREDARAESRLERGDHQREFEPDEVLALDLSRLGLARARALGFRIIRERRLATLGFRITELSAPGGIPLDTALARLRAADPGGNFDLNPRYLVAGQPACEGVRCDGHRLVSWPTSGCPQAVLVGMLDTAVTNEIAALRGANVRQRHFGSGRAAGEGADHGTEVASILVGKQESGIAGLLPRARLIVADVFDYGFGSGQGTTNAFNIARGLDWLAGEQPDVINISIAGPDNSVLHEAIQRVTTRGIPIVAAAGNLGPDGPPRYPAAYREAIAVTAVDPDGRLYGEANRGPYVDIAAPGVHIWSADARGQGRFVDGTSFAAPFVTAEVALLRRTATPAAVLDWKALLREVSSAGLKSEAQSQGPRLLKSRGCST